MLFACAISSLYHSSEKVMQKWKELWETQYVKTETHKWFRNNGPILLCLRTQYQTDGVSQQEGRGLRILQICLRTRLGQLPETDPVSKGTWAGHNGMNISG